MLTRCQRSQRLPRNTFFREYLRENIKIRVTVFAWSYGAQVEFFLSIFLKSSWYCTFETRASNTEFKKMQTYVMFYVICLNKLIVSRLDKSILDCLFHWRSCVAVFLLSIVICMLKNCVKWKVNSLKHTENRKIILWLQRSFEKYVKSLQKRMSYNN